MYELTLAAQAIVFQYTPGGRAYLTKESVVVALGGQPTSATLRLSLHYLGHLASALPSPPGEDDRWPVQDQPAAEKHTFLPLTAADQGLLRSIPKVIVLSIYIIYTRGITTSLVSE